MLGSTVPDHSHRTTSSRAHMARCVTGAGFSTRERCATRPTCKPIDGYSLRGCATAFAIWPTPRLQTSAVGATRSAHRCRAAWLSLGQVASPQDAHREVRIPIQDRGREPSPPLHQGQSVLLERVMPLSSALKRPSAQRSFNSRASWQRRVNSFTPWEIYRSVLRPAKRASNPLIVCLSVLLVFPDA